MTLREKVYAKYGGRCAYTGKPLGDDWQIDHVIPKNDWHKATKDRINSLDNLLPSLKIINHYKRDLDLEGFRKYIITLQSRINKIPKWCKDLYNGVILNPHFEDDKNYYRENIYARYRYIKQVAELFGIAPETPFSGKFYFEVCDGKIG